MNDTDQEIRLRLQERQSHRMRSRPSRRNLLLKIGAGFDRHCRRPHRRPPSWLRIVDLHTGVTEPLISLGPLDRFPQGEPRLAIYRQPCQQALGRRLPPKSRAGLRRIDSENFQVFAINFTHLGCPVRWFQESRLFMCPWPSLCVLFVL